MISTNDMEERLFDFTVGVELKKLFNREEYV